MEPACDVVCTGCGDRTAMADALDRVRAGSLMQRNVYSTAAAPGCVVAIDGTASPQTRGSAARTEAGPRQPGGGVLQFRGVSYQLVLGTKEQREAFNSMSLKHSRGTFYELYKMPRDRSFWQYFLEVSGRLETTSDRVMSLFGPSAWVPEHSNCPGLTIIIKDIVRSLPNEWRATGENIFVGRVLKGDANAGAWRTSKAGIIEIHLQYTYVLSAYIAAFDEFALSIKSAL